MTDGRDAELLDFIVLTCRLRRNDFRHHLARELAGLGHKVLYIYLKRRPELTDLATGETRQLSLPDLVRFFWSFRKKRRKPVVFNSTNLVFPVLNAFLRRISGTRWVTDMHDDLLYDAHGGRRVRERVKLALMVSQSDVIVHAAPTLQELFPHSHHLGNGSSLPALPKTREDRSQVLVIASLDDRFDFELMQSAALADPARHFSIHGHIVKGGDAGAALDRLLSITSNISYHGPYADPDLPALFARYLVSFAPYRVDHQLTRYIDPLRFYHCLATDTGLVTTAIPQALVMTDRLKIIHDAQEVGEAIDRAIAERTQPGTSWHDVAVRLVAILNLEK
ncbi:MAG: tuaH 2 [Sphingomonadales bacterium]|nr:tuaH 2 [Sphingomonadales bacterium]